MQRPARIIAVMLFRLRMTIDEAITAYTRLVEDVFSSKTILGSHKPRTSAFRLENAITKFICSSLNVEESQAQKVCMLNDNGPKWQVATPHVMASIYLYCSFVGAVTANNLSFPTLFRAYVPPRHASYNCTIVEAIRATTAEEPFFPRIDIGDANAKETFIHGGSRINNPVKALLEEAVEIFPGRPASCVLSIGSGAQGTTGFEATSITELAKVLKKVIGDGESISDEIAKELSYKEVFYCRLNVDHGLDNIGFRDWEKLGVVKTHTRKYLELYDVTQKVDRLVQILNRRVGLF